MNDSSKVLDFWLRLFVLIILLLFAFKYYLTSFDSEASRVVVNLTRSDFIKCLKHKGVILYGVDSCEYCKEQKTIFGNDFENIEYVNCDFSNELCAAKAITAYPVWEISGEKYRGLQSLPQLSKLSGCDLSLNKNS